MLTAHSKRTDREANPACCPAVWRTAVVGNETGQSIGLFRGLPRCTDQRPDHQAAIAENDAGQEKHCPRSDGSCCRKSPRRAAATRSRATKSIRSKPELARRVTSPLDYTSNSRVVQLRQTLLNWGSIAQYRQGKRRGRAIAAKSLQQTARPGAGNIVRQFSGCGWHNSGATDGVTPDRCAKSKTLKTGGGGRSARLPMWTKPVRGSTSRRHS